MPKKQTPESLLAKQLGKDVANALLLMIDKMLANRESAAEIEKAALDKIAHHIGLLVEEEIKITVKEFIKLPPAIKTNIINSVPPAIKTNVNPSVSPKISAHNKVSQVASKKITVRP